MNEAQQRRVVRETHKMFAAVLKEKGLTRKALRKLPRAERMKIRGEIIDRLKEILKNIDKTEQPSRIRNSGVDERKVDAAVIPAGSSGSMLARRPCEGHRWNCFELARVNLFALLTLAVTAFLPSVSQAQLTVPREVDAFAPLVIECGVESTETQDVQIAWNFSSDRVKTIQPGEKSVLYVWAPPGEYTVEAIVAIQTYRVQKVFVPNPDFPTDVTKAKLETIRVAEKHTLNRYSSPFKIRGDVAPVPPDPGPNPPPVPTSEFRVLMIEESANRGHLPKSQLDALTSTAVRQYLNSKSKEWRLLDKDEAVESSKELSPQLKSAFKQAPKDKLPLLVVINGGNAQTFPLPANEADLLTLLKKYGGN